MLSWDVLKSNTCGVKIPELNLELVQARSHYYYPFIPCLFFCWFTRNPPLGRAHHTQELT